MIKSIKHFLGLNMKRLRASRKLTQAELAELIGVSTTHVALMEVGKHWISDKLIDKIASTLKVSPTELFKNPDDIPKPSNLEIISIISNALNEQEVLKRLYVKVPYETISRA